MCLCFHVRSGCNLIWECNETLVNPAGLGMPAGRSCQDLPHSPSRPPPQNTESEQSSALSQSHSENEDQSEVSMQIPRWCHHCWIHLKGEDSIRVRVKERSDYNITFLKVEYLQPPKTELSSLEKFNSNPLMMYVVSVSLFFFSRSSFITMITFFSTGSSLISQEDKFRPCVEEAMHWILSEFYVLNCTSANCIKNYPNFNRKRL